MGEKTSEEKNLWREKSGGGGGGQDSIEPILWRTLWLCIRFGSIPLESVGCSITPCSVISQASCRSPDDRRGAALPQEDVGGHVGVNHTQKVSRKGGNGDQSGQTPSGSGEPLRPFSRRQFCDAVWVRLRVLFFK